MYLFNMIRFLADFLVYYVRSRSLLFAKSAGARCRRFVPSLDLRENGGRVVSRSVIHNVLTKNQNGVQRY